jgi:hypothetical protein
MRPNLDLHAFVFRTFVSVIFPALSGCGAGGLDPHDRDRRFGPAMYRRTGRWVIFRSSPRLACKSVTTAFTRSGRWPRASSPWQMPPLSLRAELEQKTHVVGSDGVERTATRASARHLESVLGRVEVPRLAYQAPGSSDLHPMDAALNLPQELYSHGLRRMVAKEAARASFDEVVELVRDYTGTTIGKRQV